MEGLQYQMLSEGRITKGETNIESLPEELLFDVLVRLPADFLHDIARPVCRRWRRIIQYSDAFINTHIQKHSTYGLVLSPSSNRHHQSIYVTATQGGRIETSELSFIRRNRPMATSCNGLALRLPRANAYGEALRLHVINPLTKKSFLLPSVSTHNRTVYHDECGIACSAPSMEYKVTLPYTTVDYDHVQYCLDIVTVGVDKSWRRVEIPPLLERFRSLFYSFPLSSEGFLHWGRGIYCLTLNVETEMITMTEAPIPPPDQRYQYLYYYLSTGRYVSLLVGRKDFSWDVWEMKLPAESGDQWRKLRYDIDLELALLQHAASKSKILYPHPLGWVKYPEIMAFSCYCGSERTCFFYNLETHEINTIDLPFKAYWRDYYSFVHRNSLVWLRWTT